MVIAVLGVDGFGAFGEFGAFRSTCEGGGEVGCCL